MNFLAGILVWLALALSALAQTNSSSTNYDYAAHRKEYHDWVLREPNNARMWSGLGICDYGMHEYREAARCLQRAVELDPSDTNSLEYWGDSLYMVRDYQAAIGPLRRLTRQVPSNREAHTFLAYSLAEVGDLAEAEKEFQVLEKSDPTHQSAESVLGVALINSGRLKEAAKEFEKALARNASDTNALLWLGDCQFLSGDLQTATNTFQKFIDVAPNDSSGSQFLGVAYAYTGQYGQAIAAYRKVVELAPSNAQTHYDLGYLLMYSGKEDEGVEEMRQAYTITPTLRYGIRLAYMLYYVGRIREAIDLYPFAGSILVFSFLGATALAICLVLTIGMRRSWENGPGLLLSSGWFGCYWACQIGGLILVSLLFPELKGTAQVLGMGLGLMLLPLSAWFKFRKAPWGMPFCPPWPFPLKWMIWTLLVFLMVYPSSTLYWYLLKAWFPHGVPEARSAFMVQRMLVTNPLLTCFVVAVLAPVVEEIMFRGLFFGALSKRFGGWTVLITAVIFGATHMDVYWFGHLTFMGICLGWLRWKSGNIWPSVLLHMMINSLSVLLMLMHASLHARPGFCLLIFW